MAKINGTLVLLDLDGETLAHVQDATLNISRELPDSFDKNSDGWAEHLEEAGQRGWEISVNGFAEYTADGNAATLADMIISRQSAPVIWGPSEAGSINFSGNASLNGLELGAPNEETATISGTVTGNGPLEKLEVSA